MPTAAHNAGSRKAPAEIARPSCRSLDRKSASWLWGHVYCDPPLGHDRASLLAVLQQGLDRFNVQCLVYGQMGKHYHVVLYTRRANLSLLMRHVNGVYTQLYNRRHGKVRHLLQGRFTHRHRARVGAVRRVDCYIGSRPLVGRWPAPPDIPG
jgi:hypothetical protein